MRFSASRETGEFAIALRVNHGSMPSWGTVMHKLTERYRDKMMVVRSFGGIHGLGIFRKDEKIIYGCCAG